MTESTVETSSKSEQDSEFRASDQASGQEKEHDSDDEMFATLKNQLASKEERRKHWLQNAENPCRLRTTKYCVKFDTQDQANAHWKLYHDTKTMMVHKSCDKCGRKFLKNKTFDKHNCNAGILDYLDKLPETESFSLPTTERRRSGGNTKTKEFLNGQKISPPKRVKRRKRIVSSTSEDSELNEALNQANNNDSKKPFLVDENPGPSKHVSPTRKKKTKPIAEIDFSDDEEPPFKAEVKLHPKSDMMKSFQKVGTIEKPPPAKKDKSGPRCPYCLIKTSDRTDFEQHFKECGKATSKTWIPL